MHQLPMLCIVSKYNAFLTFTNANRSYSDNKFAMTSFNKFKEFKS